MIYYPIKSFITYAKSIFLPRYFPTVTGTTNWSRIIT